MNEDRRNRIAELVAEKKAVTNAEIMARFGISIETVRRDLAYLESKGLIERVYGGAAARSRRISGASTPVKPRRAPLPLLPPE